MRRLSSLAKVFSVRSFVISSSVISISPSISIVTMFRAFLNNIKTRSRGIELITLKTFRSNRSGTLEFFNSFLSSLISPSSVPKLQFSNIKVSKYSNIQAGPHQFPAPGLEVSHVMEDRELKIAGEVFWVIFEDHFLDVRTGLSYESHL